jgi:hypothetical protein
MTDSGTGSTTSRVDDRQPHSTATADGEPRPEADVGARPVTEPAVEVAKPSPWYGRLARALPRSTAWIATILVGSLLVPAITKQWSDRPRELEIKTTLVREMSELTTDTITAYVAEIFVTTPAARLLGVRKAALDRASKADRVYDAKLQETAATEGQKYSAWRTKGAAIRAQLKAYFSGTQLTRDWDALNIAVISFIRLGSAGCDMSDDIKILRSYLANDQSSANIRWQLLGKSSYYDSGCYIGNAKLGDYRNTYNYVGSRLIAKQQEILDSIMKADMVGFSKGWHDLIKDMMSGGS